MDCAGYTQNRIIGSYADFNDFVIVSPEHMLISSSFFLGGGAVRLTAGKANQQVNGLVIRDNEFDYASGSQPAIKLDETEAAFTALIDCVIDGNMLDSSYHALTTRVTRRFEFVTNASSSAPYCFDLRSSLLFPQFNATSVQVTLHATDPLRPVAPAVAVVPGRASGVPAGDQRSVCIVLNLSQGGIPLAVDVTVDQSRYTVGRVAAPAADQQAASLGRHGSRARGF